MLNLVLDMGRNTWKNNKVSNFTDFIANSFPDTSRNMVKSSIQAFLRSLKVEYLQYKTDKGTLDPRLM